MRMSREQWIWTVPSALMKESAYSNAHAPSDVHVFSAKWNRSKMHTEGILLNRHRGSILRLLEIKRYQEVEIPVNSVGANVQGWGDGQAMTLSIVLSA